MSVSPPMLGSRWVAFVPKSLFHWIVTKVTPSFSAQTRKKLARSSVNSASPEGHRRTIFVNKDFFSSCYLKKSLLLATGGPNYKISGTCH